MQFYPNPFLCINLRILRASTENGKAACISYKGIFLIFPYYTPNSFPRLYCHLYNITPYISFLSLYPSLPLPTPSLSFHSSFLESHSLLNLVLLVSNLQNESCRTDIIPTSSGL